jgi:hypothetical protein
MIKNAIKFSIFNTKSLKIPFPKFPAFDFAFVTRKVEHRTIQMTQKEIKSLSFNEKINYLEEYIKSQRRKEGLLQDKLITSVIQELENVEEEEGMDNTVIISKTLYVYTLLKVIPNDILMSNIVNYLETQVTIDN